jgi:hypothetical protein
MRIAGLRNRERGMKDGLSSLAVLFSIKRVGAFREKTNFIYSHKKEIGVLLRK